MRGTSERANDGRQHSSRIVSCRRSTQPFEFGRPVLMRRCLAPSTSTASRNSRALNSEPLSVVTSLRRHPAARSSHATRWTSSRVWRARGFRSEAWSSAQAQPEATSAAVYYQTGPFVPRRRPT